MRHHVMNFHMPIRAASTLIPGDLEKLTEQVQQLREKSLPTGVNPNTVHESFKGIHREIRAIKDSLEGRPPKSNLIFNKTRSTEVPRTLSTGC